MGPAGRGLVGANLCQLSCVLHRLLVGPGRVVVAGLQRFVVLLE